MRQSIRFAASFLLLAPLGACALGATTLTPPPQKDAGVDAAPLATDAGTKTDAKADPPDANVVQDSSVKPVCSLQVDMGSPSCNACLEGSCCAQTNGCMGSSQCNDFLNCLSGCIDGDGGLDNVCANACASQNPTGASQYMTMTSCMDSFCRNDCF